MIKIALSILGLMALSFHLTAQDRKPANVYPSNLEDNMYYEKYDARSGVVSGIHFLILSDGNSSKDATPAFEVSLYLLPVGSTNPEDAVIARVYELPGLYHMGSREYENESLNLNSIEGLKEGAYRMGLWVNSNSAFEENPDDNAMLFKGELNFRPNASSKKPVKQKEKKKKEEEEDED
jgi:hypothetical protein